MFSLLFCPCVWKKMLDNWKAPSMTERSGSWSNKTWRECKLEREWCWTSHSEQHTEPPLLWDSLHFVRRTTVDLGNADILTPDSSVEWREALIVSVFLSSSPTSSSPSSASRAAHVTGLRVWALESCLPGITVSSGCDPRWMSLKMGSQPGGDVARL